jgi:hypothetical protein
MITNLARIDERSKLKNSKEKIYNSKPSSEESFETDENMKNVPSRIRTNAFNLLLVINTAY